MAAYRIPGPLCFTTSEEIDKGTMCLSRSPRPGPIIGLEFESNFHRNMINESNFNFCFWNYATISLRELLQKLNDITDNHHDYDFSTKNGTIEAIKNECISQGISLNTQIAYVLATADHETNHTFKPVTEAYWLHHPDSYLKKHHANYYPYYGRGYVQLTWNYNYKKYSKLLGEDLLKHPELALKPEIALFVLVHGFKNGSFTGKKISDYINDHVTNFVKARYCINGQDKAKEIAALAQQYLVDL
jgi:predicted chitinase